MHTFDFLDSGSYYTEGKRKVILQEKWIFLPKEKSHIIRKKSFEKSHFVQRVVFTAKSDFFFRIIWKKKPFFMPNRPKRLFKNDSCFGPFDIENGFDAKCKNPKKSFYDKNGFFFILYGIFWEKTIFGHKTIFHFVPYNTPLNMSKFRK
jgi:hypothetical protein